VGDGVDPALVYQRDGPRRELGVDRSAVRSVPVQEERGAAVELLALANQYRDLHYRVVVGLGREALHFVAFAAERIGRDLRSGWR